MEIGEWKRSEERNRYHGDQLEVFGSMWFFENVQSTFTDEGLTPFFENLISYGSQVATFASSGN